MLEHMAGADFVDGAVREVERVDGLAVRVAERREAFG
jgi:hypothetical protein